MKRICVYMSMLIFIALLSCTSKELSIGIQPYKGFNNTLIDTIKGALIKTYGSAVVVLPERSLPKTAFINVKSPRYRADSLLRDLKKNKPSYLKMVLGLTSQDISTTKRDKNGAIKKPESKYSDFGIYGLGYKPGSSCVVSTYRLTKMNKKRFFSRLKKVCIHEIGHNFGLAHCTTKKCVMADAAETIKTIDYVNMELCAKCKLEIE